MSKSVLFSLLRAWLRLAVLSIVLVVTVLMHGVTVYALTADQRKIFTQGINYYDRCGDSSGSTDGTAGATPSGGESFDLSSGDQTTIDTDGSNKKYWGTQYQQHDTNLHANSTALDTEKINWYVLQTGWADAHGNIKTGDIAALTYQGKTVYAVFGDNNGTGSSEHSEISVAATTALQGKNDNIPGKLHYTIYPGSHKYLNVTPDTTGVANAPIAMDQLQSKIDDIGKQLSGGVAPSSTSGSTECCSGSSPSSLATMPSGSKNSGSGTFNIDQEKTFLSEAVTSTWNISNSTVEQWFLKQAGAQSVIGRYGLNSSNISQITSAVQAANVSPVFFYLDAVNEGGGAGGFINHYSGDAAGGGPGNATRDAQYIASESKTTQDGPATGGGEPGDMPTTETKSLLDALPKGSIGVYYIQATSAITAELEDLSGKTGGWSGLFGHPIADMMQNIQKMGGNPMQGGSTISGGGCTGAAGGVAGQGIAKAVSWAVMIANNSGYGYDQSTRTSGWAKWQSDPGCTNACGSFDCSSLIAAALTEAGYFHTNPEFDTQTEGPALMGVGFKDVTSSVNLTTGANMQPGDILVNTADHTAMYIGDNKVVAASINENGQANGGQVGDQNGHEIATEPYYNFPWTNVYRAPN